MIGCDNDSTRAGGAEGDAYWGVGRELKRYRITCQSEVEK